MREFEQWRETFDTSVTELIGDIIEATDRVVVRQVWHFVGRGPEAHVESTVVFTLREGMISYQEYFWDHAEALETPWTIGGRPQHRLVLNGLGRCRNAR